MSSLMPSNGLRSHFRVGLSSLESRITSVGDAFAHTRAVLGLRKSLTRQRLYIILCVSSSLLLGISTTWLVKNYLLFRKLLTKDAPMKLGIWAAALVLKPFGRETISTEEYEDDFGNAWLIGDDDSVLIPERRRVRPRTGWHFLPHRQIEARPEARIAALLEQRFKEIATTNNILVKVAPSPHEGIVDALLISDFIPRETWHSVAKHAWGEIAHIHTDKDKSLHVVLSPQDCKIVIERGWGERHPISGVVGLPKEYLMIYAPMDEDEVEVVARIIKASISYMTNGREVV